MRVVGGRLRGLPIAGPRGTTPPRRRVASGGMPTLPGAEIRPTSDRLREAIFNVLAHGYGDPVPGARVIDLFAGTGAMGIEAVSRGAAAALLVDNGPEAGRLIAANLERLGIAGAARHLKRDATRLGPAPPAEAGLDLAFCDPPYGLGLAEAALAACAAGGWLRAGALVVVEDSEAAACRLPEGFAEIERRRYGRSEVMFGRLG